LRIIILILRLVGIVLGLVLLVFGLAAFGFDITVLAAPGGLAGLPLGQVWFQHDPFLPLLHSPSIQLAQVVVERKLQWPELWNPGITTILNWPSWLALTALGGCGTLLSIVVLRLAIPRRRA
jgi:hypothetical protein